jgi:MinD-like ATPase involved in chromosome partitioning or flagellar assembly
MEPNTTLSISIVSGKGGVGKTNIAQIGRAHV